MKESETLDQRRLIAARASKGISNDAIKGAVVKLIVERDMSGAIIDYGAGTGRLIGDLIALKRFTSVFGVDIFERPPSLSDSVTWLHHDLNQWLAIDRLFDVVVSTEVIEHLENPRLTIRNIRKLLKPGGSLLLTTPNQESLRSYCTLLFGGHFAGFLGASYPAHITALLRMDLERIVLEEGFARPSFYYTNRGGIPKMPDVTWQQISFNLLKGRLFSDNVIMLARLLS